MGDALEPSVDDGARNAARRAQSPPRAPGTDLSITVNGESRAVPPGSTAADLIESLGLAGRPMAVEVNEIVVPRASLSHRPIAQGDRFEIVTLVGGG